MRRSLGSLPPLPGPLILASAVGIVGVAPLAAAPLPPQRPPQLGRGPPRSQAPEPPPAPQAPPPPSEPEATPGTGDCLGKLRALGLDVEPATTPPASNGACQMDEPVRLKGIKVATRRDMVVTFNDQPLVACRFAEPFGRWVSTLVAPLAAGQLGVDIKAIRTGPGFECRNRNRATSGNISAHGKGLALDVVGFELANGETIAVKPNGNDRHAALLATVRTAACGWFTTILGPGSDPYHSDHLHLDVEQHGSSDRYRICQ